MADVKRDDPQLDLAGVERSLRASVDGADAARVGGLKQLQTIRTAMAAPLQRERDRIAVKYGAGDRRVAELDRRIEANNEFTKTLATEVERASIPAPKPDPGAWQVHGHVRDNKRSGVADLTVSLHDDKGAWIRSAGYSCTDKTGYFAPLSIKKPPAGGTAAYRPEAAVFIHVTDRKKTALFRDSQPSVPSFGTVAYREIVLSDTRPCPPPDTAPAKDGTGKGEPDKGDPDKGGSGKEDSGKDGPSKQVPDKDGPDKEGGGKGKPGKGRPRLGRDDDP